MIPSYENGLGLFVLIEKETGIRIGHAGLVKQQINGKEEIEIGYGYYLNIGEKGMRKKQQQHFEIMASKRYE